MTIARIVHLLDEASRLADELALPESRASEPYTTLAQLIDTALARAEALKDAQP